MTSPLNRRSFSSGLLGAGSFAGFPARWALATLLNQHSPISAAGTGLKAQPARAKRIISLFMHGGPSQLDLFDYKPELLKWSNQDLPESVRRTQRLTGMTSGQSTFPVTPSAFRFRQTGNSGMWMSELLPETARIADRICLIRSLYTEAINHDPAVTLMQTGHQQPGRPSFGSWMSYGLGSENHDLPTFVVLISRGSAARPADPLYARLWGSGFLPSDHQGVALRSANTPVLYLDNPPGVTRETRRAQLDAIAGLNEERRRESGDEEIRTRTQQYEMAFRMQTSVPELVDVSDEAQSSLDLYGDEVNVPGSFARNCLLARRMAERGVRFIQLYHRGWDQHYNLPGDLQLQCRDVDRPTAGLIEDLRLRGLLDDTLVVWGGEFGRTVYSQGKATAGNYGRDHHGGCFSMWIAGGGFREGVTYGGTDDFSCTVAENPVHVHDLNATLLHQLGFDHTQLTYRSQGRDYRLTDVSGQVQNSLLQ